MIEDMDIIATIKCRKINWTGYLEKEHVNVIRDITKWTAYKDINMLEDNNCEEIVVYNKS